ncbi:hypothetical protein [Mycolicibacterium mucogenicum]|uniref:hypothetical protein n=1 Tax=Mycolicibacterium mucogenicum TaxID=56689 RepID=UPI001042062F|nr:hypothetical protein [Mycolicibacterium mucogenicum]
MIIEYQFPAHAVLANLRNGLRATNICVTDPIPAGNLRRCGTGPVYLDRVDVATGDDATTLRRTPEGFVEVIQKVTARLVNESALAVAGTDAPQPCAVLDLGMVFSLFTDIDNNDQPRLHVAFARIEGLDDDLLTLVLQGFIFEVFPGVATRIPLDDLDDTLGGGLVVRGVALAATADRKRIAVRVIVDVDGLFIPPTSADFSTLQMAQLSTFIEDGALLPNPNGEAWSVFISERLVRRGLARRIRTQLQGGIDEGTIRLQSGPTVSYTPPWPVPAFPWNAPKFTIMLEVEKIGACVCVAVDIDLSAELTIGARLSVPEPNVLRSDLYLEFDLSDEEVACCVLTANLFLPIAIADIATDDDLPDALAGVLVPIVGAGPLLSIIGPTLVHGLLAGEVGEQVSSSELTPVNGSDSHFQLDQTLELGGIGVGAPTLNSVTGVGSGLILGGSLAAIPVVPVSELSLHVWEPEFSWHFPDKCAENPKVVATIAFSFSDQKVRYCGHRVVDDPLDVYRPRLKRTGRYFSLTIKRSHLTSEFRAAPYPLKVLLFTSRGVRMLTFAAPPPLSYADEQAMIAALIEQQPIICDTIVEDEGQPFWEGPRFNPHWIPDPGPEFDAGLVQVAIAGLTAGELVHVHEGPIAQAQLHASPHGTAAFSALYTGAPQLALARQYPQQGHARARRMELRQSVLHRDQRLLLRAPLRSMVATRSGETHVLAVLSEDDRVELFATHHGGPLRSRGRFRADGAVALLSAPEGLLVVDEGGVRTAADRVWRATGVRAAARTTSGYVLLVDDDVVLLDHEFGVGGRVASPGAQTLTAEGGWVVVATDTGVDWLRDCGRCRFARRASLDIRDVTALYPARNSGVPGAVLATTGTAHRLLVSDPAPRHAGGYDGLPWFARTTHIDRRIIVADTDRHALTAFVLERALTREFGDAEVPATKHRCGCSGKD